ncbi:MAG TPA: hypothetical protein VII38_21060 [Polyangia bacterium]
MDPVPPSLVEKWALAVVALVAAAGAHTLCNAFFHCGCRGWSAAHCNIHHAMGPRCPWCTAPWHFALAIALWLACAQLAIALGRRRFGRRAPYTLFAGFFGLLAGAVASAAITVWLTGYPHLF